MLGFGRTNHVESGSLEILVNFINRLSTMRKKRSKSNAGENKVKIAISLLNVAKQIRHLVVLDFFSRAI